MGNVPRNLHHLSPFDPMTLMGSIVVTAAATIAASLIPAASAARVEPCAPLSIVGLRKNQPVLPDGPWFTGLSTVRYGFGFFRPSSAWRNRGSFGLSSSPFS
jgi:hypothetical protein